MMSRNTSTVSRTRSRRGLVAAVTAAALVLVPMAVANASTSPTPEPISAVTTGAPADVTFTVGLSQDVDSLDPFKGIVVEAYEMWGLMYDSLIGFSQEDLSPVPNWPSPGRSPRTRPLGRTRSAAASTGPTECP